MKKERGKREQKIHLVPLIVGIYAAILGLGLIRIAIFGSQAGIGIVRLLMGLVIAGMGFLGIWDGIRDSMEPKKNEERTPDVQYIFMDTEGRRSSHVSPEQLREQLKAVAEMKGCAQISLSILPPLVVPEKGSLGRLVCAFGGHEKPLCLLALFLLDSGKELTLIKEEEPEQAAEHFEKLLAGNAVDFSGWQTTEIKKEPKNMPVHKRLTLIGESYRNDHEFFSGRDLELVIEGLGDGSYLQMEMVLGDFSLYAVRDQEEESYGESSCITLYLHLPQGNGGRKFKKTGTVSQVKFWLTQMINNGIRLYGWEEVTGQKK